MTDFDDDMQTQAEAPRPDKPCLALMGEFSAGKSTLSNLLIGGHSLPVQVTATQLPPVWIAYGDKPPYRVDLDGNVLPVDLNHLGDVNVADTAYIRIFRQSEMLEICDIIDMPGISDPSMAADVWQRVIHHATSVIWCTHATQAWRQSEAAVWDGMPPDLFDTSVLLLTRMDKITNENDRARLLRRVRKETEGLFAEVLPISLLQAVEAGDDKAAWDASGAELFSQTLVDILKGPDGPRRPTSSGNTPRPLTAVTSDGFGGDADTEEEAHPAVTVAAGTVMPKRVSPRTGLRPANRRSDRPDPQAAQAG